MKNTRIVIAGAGGRMGRILIDEILTRDQTVLLGGIEPEDSALMGEDLGLLAGHPGTRLRVTADPLPLFAEADAVIDFSVPEAAVRHAALAAQARIVHVIGVTGLTPEQQKQINAAARHATIIQEGNMSLGVNLLAALVRKTAAVLDTDWDIEICEMHHRHKVDAPSGTALLLGEAAAQGREVDLDTAADRGRDGQTGIREQGAIGFAALRGGSVTGDHSVIFATGHERLVFSHIAEDRRIFAKGAVAAALWGRDKKPGLYGMADVLGLDTL